MTSNWTLAVRQRLAKDFPPDHVLPDKQPSFVRSAVYLFGALTIASFALIIVTGTVLAIFGPQWWHTNGVGHFFNSTTALGTCMDRSRLVYFFVLGGTEERLGTTQPKRRFYAESPTSCAHLVDRSQRL